MRLLSIGVIITILSIIVRRNKALYCIQLGYMWLVASFNNMNPDYTNYLNGYNLMHSYHGTITEPMYWLMVRCSGSIGLDYQGFRLVFFFLAYALLGIAIWKLSPFPNSILGLYMVLPYTEDIIQMRTLMANALSLWSILELERYDVRKTKGHLLKSMVFLAAGTGFHYATGLVCIAYLALIERKHLRELFRVLILGMIILIIFTVLFINCISTIIHQSGIIPKFATYYIHFESAGGYRWGIFALRLLLVFICYLAIKSERCIGIGSDMEIQGDVRFLYKVVVLLSVLAFVELFVSMELGRLLRIPLLLSTVLISRTMVHMRMRNRTIVALIVVIYYFALFYWSMFMHYSEALRWFEHVFIPIFSNNLLI